MSEAETHPGSEEPFLRAVTVHVTQIDMARWDNYVQNHKAPRVTWLFRYIPASVLLFIAILNFSAWDAPWWGGLGLIATAAWFWALGWPIHWAIRWRWGGRLGTDGLPQPTTLFATGEGLHIEDDFRAWNEFLRTDRARAYFYLFPDETRAFIVPRHCFPNHAAFSQFVETCESRIAEAGEYQDRPDDDPPAHAIRYTVSSGGLARRNDEFLRRVGVRGPLWLRLPLACFFTVISVAMWPWWQGLSALMLGPGNLLVALWNLLPAPYERWVSRSWARKSLGGRESCDVAIWYDDAGVWWWERGYRRLFRWTGVGVAEPYNHSAIIYVSPTEALPVPASAFESEQAFESFIEAIRERTIMARAA